MKYLQKSVEDINNAFIINPYQSKYFEGELNGNAESLRLLSQISHKYDFPQSESAIIKAWGFHDEHSISVEMKMDYDKIVIDLSDYEQPKPYAILNFRVLDNLLNESVFEKELKASITKRQRHFIKKDIDYDVLNASNDFKIKNYLSLYLKDLEDSIKSINSLKLNKVQTLVGELYIASYNATIDYINKTYHEYVPKIEDESLNKIILHNKINKLLTIESELIERGYISKSGSKLYWNSKRGNKVKLINFCRLLLSNGYIKEYFEIGKVIAYFEGRYNLDTGNQAKPSKFKESDKVIEGDFIFLKF